MPLACSATPAHRSRFAALALAAILSLAACGADTPRPAPARDPASEANMRIGDVTVRTHVVPTTQLVESVARGYGIRREAGKALLVVSVRKGPEGEDVSIPATVSATVANLQGQTLAVPLRELRTGDLVDYVGLVDHGTPDTLVFKVQARHAGNGSGPGTITFRREFAP